MRTSLSAASMASAPVGPQNWMRALRAKRGGSVPRRVSTNSSLMGVVRSSVSSGSSSLYTDAPEIEHDEPHWPRITLRLSLHEPVGGRVHGAAASQYARTNLRADDGWMHAGAGFQFRELLPSP
jgi:hypothetical protein